MRRCRQSLHKQKLRRTSIRLRHHPRWLIYHHLVKLKSLIHSSMPWNQFSSKTFLSRNFLLIRIFFSFATLLLHQNFSFPARIMSASNLSSSCESSAKRNRSKKRRSGASNNHSMVSSRNSSFRCRQLNIEMAACQQNENFDFTSSGFDPPQTVGALSSQHDHFAKYAPAGPWATCDERLEKCFDACQTCSIKGNVGDDFFYHLHHLNSIHSTLRTLRTMDRKRTRPVHLTNGRVHQKSFSEPAETMQRTAPGSTHGKDGAVANKWIMPLCWTSLRPVPSVWSLQESRPLRRLDLQDLAGMHPTADALPTVLGAGAKRTTSVHAMSPTSVPTLQAAMRSLIPFAKLIPNSK